MKKIVLIVVLMAFSSCTKLFSSRLQTTLKSNPISDGITYHDYNMIMSSSSATFTHIASVNAHILNGKLLQATGFEVQNSYAFIVYNTAGDTIRGGLDIISLSTLNAPVLVSSVVSENTEYAEVKASGNYLYMVGQKKNINKNDAMLTIVDMSNKSAPFVVSELVFPNGYYATSIDIQGQNAYISVPNEGVKVVNISNPLSPLLVSTEVSSFGNSLYVRRLDSKSIVLGGSSSHNVSSISNGVSIGLKQISTKVQEAPSRFILNNNSYICSKNDKGTYKKVGL